ncbi:MAG: hypothetical protein KTR25_01375 [Myxococcales bacterium]|nr:hypothetical protein [Myxococcales bacterium]
MYLSSGGGNDAVARVCEGSVPEGRVRGRGARKGGRSQRTLTKVGYTSERGP